MERDFPFMDVRRHRQFIKIEDFALRSGIDFTLLSQLASAGAFDYVVVAGDRWISWDQHGTGVDPSNSLALIDEKWRALVKETKHG
jgi:hypothetical protein